LGDILAQSFDRIGSVVKQERTMNQNDPVAEANDKSPLKGAKKNPRVGDMYMNGNTGKLYICTDADPVSWVDIGKKE
jgi:hypothetical protein